MLIDDCCALTRVERVPGLYAALLGSAEATDSDDMVAGTFMRACIQLCVCLETSKYTHDVRTRTVSFESAARDVPTSTKHHGRLLQRQTAQ